MCLTDRPIRRPLKGPTASSNPIRWTWISADKSSSCFSRPPNLSSSPAVGPGIPRPGKELVDFVEKTGIPAFTSSLGRGTIPDTHPLCFESSLAIRPGAALLANMSADLVLFLGARMSLFYIFGDLFNKEAKIIQVDIEAEEIGRNRSVDLAVVSDIQGLLAVCNRLIEEKKSRFRTSKKV